MKTKSGSEQKKKSKNSASSTNTNTNGNGNGGGVMSITGSTTPSSSRDASNGGADDIPSTLYTEGDGNNGGGGGSGSRWDKSSKLKGRGGAGDSSVSNHASLQQNNQHQETVLDVIPQDYLFNPNIAEPCLHYLPKAVALAANAAAMSAAQNTQANNTLKFPNLRLLLAAAEDDLRLHRARVQAGKATDPSLLRSYKIATDATWLARQQRLNERVLMLQKLDTERTLILKELLQAGDSTTRGLTAKEKTQVQLARWQRALELYVYAPPHKTSPSSSHLANNNNATDASSSSALAAALKGEENNLDLLGLLEKLLEGIAEVREKRKKALVCLYFTLWSDSLSRTRTCFISIKTNIIIA
jgi:hypothetical protein